MIDLTTLKLAVINQPHLIKMVNQLESDRLRLAMMIVNLNRLDEAITQRLFTFDELKASPIPLVNEIASNCQELLIVISSFINMTVTPPDQRANDAISVYNDLMKRM